MSDLDKIFNRFKNLLYTNNYVKYKLTDLAALIQKENKTTEDIELLREIDSYATVMEHSIEDLGTKIGTINSENFKLDGTDSYKQNEEHVRDIIFDIDNFIDALVAFTRIFKVGDTAFLLKKSSTYLKAIRGKFVQKASEFKIRIMKDKREEEIFRLLINDTLDIFLQEAYSLRLAILGDKIKEALKNYDSKHRRH
jgi:hypothetical protein